MIPEPASPQPPVLVTVAEAARVLRCSPVTVRREVRSGRLSALRLGRRGLMRIDLRDLEALRAHPAPRPGRQGARDA